MLGVTHIKLHKLIMLVMVRNKIKTALMGQIIIACGLLGSLQEHSEKCDDVALTYSSVMRATFETLEGHH